MSMKVVDLEVAGGRWVVLVGLLMTDLRMTMLGIKTRTGKGRERKRRGDARLFWMRWRGVERGLEVGRAAR
jgi:hypothetical protein